jgi:hypothetical protein
MGRVSLHDPSAVRPGRVIFASALTILALAGAVVAGWGWAIFAVPDQDLAAHALAIFAGMAGAIGLMVASGFAWPVRWRASDVAGPLFTGLAGLLLMGAGAGMAIALGSLRLAGWGWLIPPAVLLTAGVVLLLIAPLTYVRRRRRTADQQEMVQTGQRSPGLVTEVTQTAMVDNVPRWRIVVSFRDSSGATRWVTEHHTTWQPPSVNQEAVVYYNPTNPGDQRHIVVRW